MKQFLLGGSSLELLFSSSELIIADQSQMGSEILGYIFPVMATFNRI